MALKLTHDEIKQLKDIKYNFEQYEKHTLFLEESFKKIDNLISQQIDIKVKILKIKTIVEKVKKHI